MEFRAKINSVDKVNQEKITQIYEAMEDIKDQVLSDQIYMRQIKNLEKIIIETQLNFTENLSLDSPFKNIILQIVSHPQLKYQPVFYLNKCY